jgi:hypothetical protein
MEALVDLYQTTELYISENHTQLDDSMVITSQGLACDLYASVGLFTTFEGVAFFHILFTFISKCNLLSEVNKLTCKMSTVVEESWLTSW